MKKPNILLVDDEPISIQAIKSHLIDNGYDVISISSARVAKILLFEEGASYDLIIVDRIMEDMDGVALIKTVKANSRYQHTPIIMITATEDHDGYVEAIQAGASELLYKPVDLNLLLHTVTSVMDKSESPSISEDKG